MPHTSTTLPEEHRPPSNTPPKNESNDDEEIAERKRISESLDNMVAEIHELIRLQQELDAEDALFEGVEGNIYDHSEDPDPASSQTEAVALISQDTSTNASTRDHSPLVLSTAPHSAQLSHLKTDHHSQRQQRDSVSPSTKPAGGKWSVYALEGKVGDLLEYGNAVYDKREVRGARVGDSVVWDFEVVGVRLGEGGWVLWEEGKGEGGGLEVLRVLGVLRVDGLA